MLVLKRRRQQSVQIGPDVTVTLLQISGDWVKLGIEAPPQWLIDRLPQVGQDNSIFVRPVDFEGDMLS